MAGDAKLGAVLRELRTARQLTLDAVARQARCTQSLISYVESGRRRLHPWLAEELDRIYETGGVVTSLMRNTACKVNDGSHSGDLASDIFVVSLPERGVAMPLSRREVLAALAVGIVTGSLQGKFERILDNFRLDGDPLAFFAESLSGFQKVARTLPPRRVIDGLVGNVAVLDGLRRRATEDRSHQYSSLQARYAESLSWLSEESGDLSGAIYWIDRASQWSQASKWPAMAAYSFVRRSMVVISFSGNGRQAVDQVRPVLTMPDVSPRILGYGSRAIPVLEPRLDSLSRSSARTATITQAKLARAYANAGQPAEACRISWEALNAIDSVGSLSARSELRRSVPTLKQWLGRSDVRDVVHRLEASEQTTT